MYVPFVRSGREIRSFRPISTVLRLLFSVPSVRVTFRNSHFRRRTYVNRIPPKKLADWRTKIFTRRSSVHASTENGARGLAAKRGRFFLRSRAPRIIFGRSIVRPARRRFLMKSQSVVTIFILTVLTVPPL